MTPTTKKSHWPYGRPPGGGQEGGYQTPEKAPWSPGGGIKMPYPGGGIKTPYPGHGGGIKMPYPGGGIKTPYPGHGGGIKMPYPGGGIKTPYPGHGGGIKMPTSWPRRDPGYNIPQRPSWQDALGTLGGLRQEQRGPQRADRIGRGGSMVKTLPGRPSYPWDRGDSMVKTLPGRPRDPFNRGDGGSVIRELGSQAGTGPISGIMSRVLKGMGSAVGPMTQGLQRATGPAGAATGGLAGALGGGALGGAARMGAGLSKAIGSLGGRDTSGRSFSGGPRRAVSGIGKAQPSIRRQRDTSGDSFTTHDPNSAIGKEMLSKGKGWLPQTLYNR